MVVFFYIELFIKQENEEAIRLEDEELELITSKILEILKYYL